VTVNRNASPRLANSPNSATEAPSVMMLRQNRKFWLHLLRRVRLERAGLVARAFSPSDRRLTYATLTEQGTEALRRSGPMWAPIVERHFARHLSAADLRCVREALAKVVAGNTCQRDAG